MDRGDRLRVVARAVELGHAHAAEALPGDGQALAAEVHMVMRSRRRPLGLRGGARPGAASEPRITASQHGSPLASRGSPFPTSALRRRTTCIEGEPGPGARKTSSFRARAKWCDVDGAMREERRHAAAPARSGDVLRASLPEPLRAPFQCEPLSDATRTEHVRTGRLRFSDATRATRTGLATPPCCSVTRATAGFRPSPRPSSGTRL